MRITKRQLRRIIREETAKATKQYDDDSALKGDQSKLPDGLQKGIIDKTVEDREEAEGEEAANEVRRMIQDIMLERRTGNPAIREEESELIRAVEKFYDKYMLVMGMDPSNPRDLQRTRRTIDDLIGAVMDVL